MINGSQFSHLVNRLQPIDGDHSDDQPDERKKRRVLYQGRQWGKAENELPVQPSHYSGAPPVQTKIRKSPGVYADRPVVERAHALLNHMTTFEEKVAQLCFYETEAVYDAALQRDAELIIQTWQVGGIVFKRGNYRRQAYLIERFQEVSKTALLIANDFMHGLSFYLQGDQLPQEELPEQRYSDVAKAVMVQNRKLGVHIQFDQERCLEKLPMNPKQEQAFRRGIREAQGIVGKEKVDPKGLTSTQPNLKREGFPILSFSELKVQETIGFGTLSFFDASSTKEPLEEVLLNAFNNHFDVFLLKDNISDAIRVLCRLVRMGRIREEELERRILKVLVIKALYFNK